ncbi:MAG: cation diffusion facilitator family transporter, partial [Paraburkholderia nemoris]
GSLAGVRLLDPIAAAIVGFMVARMGWMFGWDALQDLSDRALDDAATADMRTLLLSTPGVRDVHEMRTRKMGDFALVDAHILVDPLISVSEGHYIAESARLRVLTDNRVLDALIHVDPENDALARPPFDLPTRERVIAEVNAALASHGVKAAAVNIHYLSTGLDVEVVLPDALSSRVLDGETQRLGRVDLAALKARLGARRVELLQALDVASAAQADPETLGAKGGVAIEERTKATEPHSAT